MKSTTIISLFVVTLAGSIVLAQEGAVSIFELQYTTASDGQSPYHWQFVDCLGGIVTHKVSRSVPRIVLYDPIIRDSNVQDVNCCWGAIQVKDWSYGDLFDNVNVGDWIELNYVLIEDYRGTTFIQYAKGGTASSFSIISSNHSVPAPLVVDIDAVTSPLEDSNEAGSYYVGNHDAEKYESMWIKVQNVSVVEKGLGKASDNYVLQSSLEQSDPNFSCWAADYMNTDAVGGYHPYVEIDQHFCSIEGIFEQYTKISDGFDYYQLITTKTADFLLTQPGDFDDDCDVDFVDFSGFAEYWLASCPADPNVCGQADLIDDDVVNEYDLAEFTSHWLEGIQ